MTQRSMWSIALAVVVAAATACDEDKAVDDQQVYWNEWCDELDCDPNDPLWQDGLINGHQVQAVKTCPVNTGYPGDESALCVPEEGSGFQLHFGPSDYSDSDDVARFLLGPREEDERCQYVRATNTEAVYVNQYAGRMRPQSHHMILWGPVGEDHEEGLADCRAAAGLNSGFLSGSQTPRVNVPDLNGARDLTRGQAVNRNEPGMLTALDLHFVNRSPETILMEGWMNLYTTEPAETDEVLNPIFLAGFGFEVPPNSVGNKFQYSCPVPENMRVQLLTGHHHENSPRFSIWIQRAGSQDRELVYENLNALDPLMATYANTFELNEPDRVNGISGGKSGELLLQAGDRLVWECEFDNPTDTPVSFGETSTDQMCNVFGAYVSEMDLGTWNAASISPTTCVAGELAEMLRP